MNVNDEQAMALFEANEEMGTEITRLRTELETLREELDDAQLYVIAASRMLDEWKALRGIAKRLADGWQPTILWTGTKTYHFEWTNDEGEDDPMTEAEVHAIYDTEDEEL